MQTAITKLVALCVQGITAREEHRDSNDMERAISQYNALQWAYSCVPQHCNDVAEWTSNYLTRPLYEWFDETVEDVSSLRIWQRELPHSVYCNMLPLLERDKNDLLIPTPEYIRLKEAFDSAGVVW